MKKLAMLILLCALLGGCAEQFQVEGQGDDSSELVSNVETTTTTTTTQSTTSTTETSTYEPIEVEIDDPLAGFVSVEYTPLYEVETTDVRPEVLADDVPDENLEGTYADVFLSNMYGEASNILFNFDMPGIIVTLPGEVIIYDGINYAYAVCPYYSTMSEFVDFCNLFLTENYILSLLSGDHMNGMMPFIEYQNKLYARDGIRGSDMGLSGKVSFYKISETENQAIYEVYYWYDSEFTGWEDGARKRYVVLQKENGRWLVADGGFWMDLL